MTTVSKHFAVYFFAVLCLILLFSTDSYAGSVTLYWDEVTENTDNSQLTDLSGYVIYYDTVSRNAGDSYTYSDDININSLSDSANPTSVVYNISSGTWYFRVAAYNSIGNESIKSDEISITVNPAPAPEIVVSDSISPAGDYQIPFGDVTVGSPLQQHVTITNNGNADLMIGNIAQYNPISFPFSILNDNCSGQTISPSSNCTLTVRFAPSSTGSFNDSFDIPSDDPNENTVTLSVSGTGLAVPIADITVTDSVAPTGNLQIPFGDVTESSSSQHTVTITNNGNADLTIGNIAQNNTVALPFSILNDSCSGQSIAPSSNCTLTVRFAPYSTESLNDSFDIPSDDPDEGTVTLSVSGTGLSIPVPDMTVNDSVVPVSDQQIPFGEVTEGSVSQQNITITNNGNADLVIGTIAQSNPIALPFGILNDYCSGQSISPSSNCALTVRFSPSSSGSFNNSFDIPSDDPDENPVIVTVSGTGLSSVVNNPPSEPALVFPAHGQRGLGKKVGMKWKKSKDPDGDVVTYDVHICSDESLTTDCTTGMNILALSNTNIYYAGVGTGFLFVGMIVTLLFGSKNKRKLALLAVAVLIATIPIISCGGGGAGGVSGAVISSEYTGDEISYSVDLEASTIYYWKVVAEDGNGGEASSEVRSFETL